MRNCNEGGWSFCIYMGLRSRYLCQPFLSTVATKSSASSTKASGSSIAAKCPPCSCLLYQTRLPVVFTHDTGVGAKSSGKHEYPRGTSKKYFSAPCRFDGGSPAFR